MTNEDAEPRNDSGGVGGVEAEQLLNSRDVALSLGITVQTVRRYVDAGLIPAVRVGPKRLVRVKAADLDAYKAANATTGAAVG